MIIQWLLKVLNKVWWPQTHIKCYVTFLVFALLYMYLFVLLFCKTAHSGVMLHKHHNQRSLQQLHWNNTKSVFNHFFSSYCSYLFWSWSVFRFKCNASIKNNSLAFFYTLIFINQFDLLLQLMTIAYMTSTGTHCPSTEMQILLASMKSEKSISS